MRINLIDTVIAAFGAIMERNGDASGKERERIQAIFNGTRQEISNL